MSIDKKKFVPNSFQLANAFVDDAMEHLSGNAVKIYLVVVRKTRGWQKEADRISLSQFEAYTGMTRKTVIKAVGELVAIGLLSEVKGGRAINQYTLNDETLSTAIAADQCKNSTGVEITLGENLHQSGSVKIPLDQCKNSTKSSGEIPLNGSGKIPHTKDTITKTKNNLLNKGEKDSFFEDQKPVNASTLGCERQTESPKPNDRICAFSGLELLTFKKILAVYPNATQQAVRSNADRDGLDVLRYMQKLLEQAA